MSGLVGLKEDDVILASYPRSGNTWVRFFFCNLISLKEWSGQDLDFEILNDTMPEFGVNNLVKSWSHNTIPRIVKTHKKCWPIFENKRSILIIRDPRDVMVSYYHFKKDKKGELSTVDFSNFIRTPKFGLRAWFEHYLSWRENYDLLVKYEDMKRDDVAEFARMVEFLELPLEESIIREASNRASFSNVRSVEEDNEAETELENNRDESKFARDGSTKQWEDYFESDDLKYFQDLKQSFGVEVY